MLLNTVVSYQRLHQSVTDRTTYCFKLLNSLHVRTRLDYCNSLLYGISDDLYRQLQSVAAGLITDTRRWKHTTPLLQQLHWLPVRQRVQLKIAVLVYKALHDLLPT